MANPTLSKLQAVVNLTAFLELALKEGYTLDNAVQYLAAALDAEDEDVFCDMHAELRMVDFTEYCSAMGIPAPH